MTEFDDMEMELLGVGQRRPSKLKGLMADLASMLRQPSWLLGLNTSTHILQVVATPPIDAVLPVVVLGSLDQGGYSCASGSTPSASWSQ